ncbi:SET domain protein, putative [Plasmodium yoelii]|uniref:SET domain protein n=3 Tax=Plasmodium yoelii TaxID=5861 RepID=A0AAE9WTT1_PLAYO|nr:SET domain protein, putative [Plasmodium yoelii]WBY58460.1 SET domain protein [Plasmodium yoelii yoelii]CDU18782.1 SET domain protein, putative [Plasmodium yoelii]VTZ79367.1 SET domain protein, putative [Plasmodium yoelii]|eukprot:XP_730659.2 SET domain protein, putative [Plasmodium yoelii]
MQRDTPYNDKQKREKKREEKREEKYEKKREEKHEQKREQIYNGEDMSIKQKNELLEIVNEIPKLYEDKENEIISSLIYSYIHKYPKSIESYESFINFYIQIKNYKSALNLLYAVIYLDKDNKKFIELMKNCEEKLVSKICKIPAIYKSQLSYPEKMGLYRDSQHIINRINNETISMYGQNDPHHYMNDNTTEPVLSEDIFNNKIHIVKQGKHYIALAKHNIEPGEIIFQEKPYMLTQHIFSNNYTYSTCYHCLKERNVSEKSYACPINPHDCPYIFCNWKCLINNIKVHEIECSILPIIDAASKESGIMYYTVLHIFRVLIKTRIERNYNNRKYNILNDIFSVYSYYNAVKENQKNIFKSFNILANRIILEFPSSFYLYLKQKELVEFMLIIWQYSPFIKYYSPSLILQNINPEITFGLVYSPILSKLHHSCIPTCSYYYDENGILIIRAICKIPEGGKLCINILPDQYLPLKIRKSFKGIPRVFACDCIRCSDPTENNLHLRSIKCPKCIIGYIYPIKTESLVEALKLHWYDQELNNTISNVSENSNELDVIHNEENIISQKNISLNSFLKYSKQSEGNINGSNSTYDNKNISQNKTRDMKNSSEINKKSIEQSSSKNSHTHYLNEEKKKKICSNLEKEIERWICSNCGKLSLKGNKRCVKLENKIYLLYNEAENNYIKGNVITARNKLLKVSNEFFNIFHPNHYIIFNVNVLLAGLLRHDPNKQVFDSLIFFRRAIIAADNVLPPCSLEKIHLYACLAHYTFNCSNISKLYNKGFGLSSKFIFDPMYASIWNSYTITGYKSTLTILLLQKLRTYSISMNKFTPHMDIEFHINRKDEFSDFYRKVTHNKNESFRHIKQVTKNDPFYPIYMACQCMDINFEENKYFVNIFKSFKNIYYLGNGLNALCLAAGFGNVNLVKVLLKLNYSLFFKNELNINALLHMASSYLPDEQNAYHSNYYYTLLKEIELQHVELELFEKDYFGEINTASNDDASNQNFEKKHNYMNPYNFKNKIENPIPFDLLMDDEFVYGEKSKDMDNRQKNILILFISHLYNLQKKKKKIYKRNLKFNQKIMANQTSNFISQSEASNITSSDKESESDVSSIKIGEYHNKYNNLRVIKNHENTESEINRRRNDRYKRKSAREKKMANLSYNSNKASSDFSKEESIDDLNSNKSYSNNNDNANANSNSNAKFNRPLKSLENVDKSSISRKKKKQNSEKKIKSEISEYSESSNSSTVDKSSSINSQTSFEKYYYDEYNIDIESTSENSEDVLNNKMNNYFCEKMLIQSVSHKLLGFNNALHYACVRGKRELAKQLLISGVPVMLLNGEGNTPLHMSAFSGHNEIVKTLIEFKTDVNSVNTNGETPLMLATYQLHFNVIKTLIEHNASVVVNGVDVDTLKNTAIDNYSISNSIARNNNNTILHCLVYGILKTHKIFYKNKLDMDDIATVTNHGFSELTSSKYLTQTSTYLNINHTISNIPIIEQLSHDFFLLPFKLLHRIKKAIIIIKYLMVHCPIYLYEIKNSNGYNPFELLKAIWKKLCERRIEILGVSDLRMSSFSDNQKNIVFQGWSLITSLINILLSILRTDTSVLTSIYKNFIRIKDPNSSTMQLKEIENKSEHGEEQSKETTNKNGAILKKTSIMNKSGEIEKKSGEIEKKSGDIEKKSGDIEKKSGEIGKKSGEIGKKSGEIENKSGEIENKSGENENKNGVKPKVSKKVLLKKMKAHLIKNKNS